MRVVLSIAFSVLAAIPWAVPVSGAAHLFAGKRASQVSRGAANAPQPARFHVDDDRGLLISAWVNGRGPFVFVIDTGAGLNVISERLVNAAGLRTTQTSPTLVGGLSGVTTSSNRAAAIDTLALGYQNNLLPSPQSALIVNDLPPGIDGILNPTVAFAPHGYAIDMPNERIESLSDSLEQSHSPPAGGAIVAWLSLADSDGPFVKLGDGRLALIDTGSRFGLAVSDRQAIVVGRDKTRRTIPSLDLGGGTVNARRVAPTTISIGELVLRGIPTDIVSGGAADAPVILGRDALYPFKLSFYPRRRLIEFAPSER
ncbi:MAG: pepsin/retropepsin-like aspartic protease family protein [bacterium]